MPIPAAIRRLYYSREWYNNVRPAALARAGYRCARCGVAAGAVGYRNPNGLFHPVPIRRRHGRRDLIVIRLHVAHRNHTPGDNRDENLMVACARCHFLFDLQHHHETRATRKDAARPLLVEIERPDLAELLAEIELLDLS